MPLDGGSCVHASNGDYIGQLALRRKVAGNVRIVEISCISIHIRFHFYKMLRLRPIRIGASRRIGRASRVEYNPLMGSVVFYQI